MTKRIAIQGYPGSFHHLAAKRFFGEQIEIVPCATFPKLIQAAQVESQADGAVMAIENSIAGSLLPNYSLIQHSGLKIAGEVFLNIDQNLMALPGQALTDIKEIHSHPMALLQCSDFIDTQDHWRVIETVDTALSAQEIKEQNLKSVAAIASSLAAEIHGLEILVNNIHNYKENYTRFLVLHRKDDHTNHEETHDKASIVFQVSHSRGSLAAVLYSLAKEGINLSKIQSFPIPAQVWKYFFHADLEYDSTEQLKGAMKNLEPLTRHLEVLGTYHRGSHKF